MPNELEVEAALAKQAVAAALNKTESSIENVDQQADQNTTDIDKVIAAIESGKNSSNMPADFKLIKEKNIVGDFNFSLPPDVDIQHMVPNIALVTAERDRLTFVDKKIRYLEEGNGISDSILLDTSIFFRQKKALVDLDPNKAVNARTDNLFANGSFLTDTESPYGADVLELSKKSYFVSALIPVIPGEEIRFRIAQKVIDYVALRTLSAGVRMYDANRNPISVDDGYLTHFDNVNDVLADGIDGWIEFTENFTIPEVHDIYSGSDGLGVCFIKLELRVNYTPDVSWGQETGNTVRISPFYLDRAIAGSGASFITTESETAKLSIVESDNLPIPAVDTTASKNCLYSGVVDVPAFDAYALGAAGFLKIVYKFTVDGVIGYGAVKAPTKVAETGGSNLLLIDASGTATGLTDITNVPVALAWTNINNDSTKTTLYAGIQFSTIAESKTYTVEVLSAQLSLNKDGIDFNLPLWGHGFVGVNNITNLDSNANSVMNSIENSTETLTSKDVLYWGNTDNVAFVNRSPYGGKLVTDSAMNAIEISVPKIKLNKTLQLGDSSWPTVYCTLRLKISITDGLTGARSLLTISCSLENNYNVSVLTADDVLGVEASSPDGVYTIAGPKDFISGGAVTSKEEARPTVFNIYTTQPMTLNTVVIVEEASLVGSVGVADGDNLIPVVEIDIYTSGSVFYDPFSRGLTKLSDIAGDTLVHEDMLKRNLVINRPDALQHRRNLIELNPNNTEAHISTIDDNIITIEIGHNISLASGKLVIDLAQHQGGFWHEDKLKSAKYKDATLTIFYNVTPDNDNLQSFKVIEDGGFNLVKEVWCGRVNSSVGGSNINPTTEFAENRLIGIHLNVPIETGGAHIKVREANIRRLAYVTDDLSTDSEFFIESFKANTDEDILAKLHTGNPMFRVLTQQTMATPSVQFDEGTDRHHLTDETNIRSPVASPGGTRFLVRVELSETIWGTKGFVDMEVNFAPEGSNDLITNTLRIHYSLDPSTNEVVQVTANEFGNLKICKSVFAGTVDNNASLLNPDFTTPNGAVFYISLEPGVWETADEGTFRIVRGVEHGASSLDISKLNYYVSAEVDTDFNVGRLRPIATIAFSSPTTPPGIASATKTGLMSSSLFNKLSLFEASADKVKMGDGATSISSMGDGAISIGTTASGGIGKNSVAIGNNAHADEASAVAIGNGSLTRDASTNVAIGYLAAAVDGGSTTAIGATSEAKTFAATAYGTYARCWASNGLALGPSTFVAAAASKSAAIGYLANMYTPEYIRLGSTTATIQAQKALAVVSDARDKTDITDLSYSYEFIMGLRSTEWISNPRNAYFDIKYKEVDLLDKDGNPIYEINETGLLVRVTKTIEEQVPVENDGSRAGKRRHVGFIAQEVKVLADSLGFDFIGYSDENLAGGADQLSLTYESFISPMVKTIQYQDKRISELEKIVSEQNKTIADLLTRFNKLENK